MCWCTPNKRTPWCGAPGCHPPGEPHKEGFKAEPAACKHEDFHSQVKIARFENTGGFLAEISICCAQCGKPFQFLGLEPGLDLQGARMDLEGLEARIAICPQGAKPSPLQQMSRAVQGFDIKVSNQ